LVASFEERLSIPVSTYRLEALLAPKSIAVVGASPREHSLGRIVLRNLRNGGFTGPIVGIADDPTFGPIVAFGCGDTAVEVIDDKALAQLYQLAPPDDDFAVSEVGKCESNQRCELVNRL
jgi:hypothetical protein